MTRRMRKRCSWLAVVALIGGAGWAWYAVAGRPGTGTPGEPPAVYPASAVEEVRLPPIEPLQFHLIPRSQPTPLSASFQPPRPQE
jgi:hypothetical protein